MLFYFLFLSLISWLLISILYWSLKNGITPTITTSKAKHLILNHVPTIGQGKIIELGSGWGTMAFAFADRFPNCQVVAFETSFFPFLYAKLQQFFFPRPNLIFLRQDFFTASLQDATLIYCYLYPAAMQRLKLKFESQLPQACTVISYTFAIPSWQPARILQVDDLYHNKVYLYSIFNKPPHIS